MADFWAAIAVLLLTYASLIAYFVVMDGRSSVGKKALFQAWEREHSSGVAAREAGEPCSESFLAGLP